jgi:predicted protein tyrosine phosphatase
LAKTINILFVCSQNRLRSPTAEQVFADHPGVETASAGTNNDAENPLTSELVRWADIIFVMEKAHRNKLQRRYRAEFMDEGLVRLLKAKVPRYLPA